MNLSDRLGRKDWGAGLVLGTGLGALILGIGGRIAMSGIALLTGQTPGFSVGGSMTVVLMGAVSGLAGAGAFVGLRLLLPRFRFVRGTLFWVFLLLVSLRGLRPVDPQRLALFLPLVCMYGTALQVLWCRFYWPRRASAGFRTATV